MRRAAEENSLCFFFFSSRRRHTRFDCDWSSDVCSSDLKQAEELMALAVEAAQSRHLPGFLEQFALRSTRMLDAIWGGVAVYRGRETELHISGGGPTTKATTDWLISRARARQNDVESLAIPKE